MTGSYANNKKSIANWSAKNRERVNAINKKSSQGIRDWKKISKIFMNILLD